MRRDHVGLSSEELLHLARAQTDRCARKVGSYCRRPPTAPSHSSSASQRGFASLSQHSFASRGAHVCHKGDDLLRDALAHLRLGEAQRLEPLCLGHRVLLRARVSDEARGQAGAGTLARVGVAAAGARAAASARKSRELRGGRSEASQTFPGDAIPGSMRSSSTTQPHTHPARHSEHTLVYCVHALATVLSLLLSGACRWF